MTALESTGVVILTVVLIFVLTVLIGEMLSIAVTRIRSARKVAQ